MTKMLASQDLEVVGADVEVSTASRRGLQALEYDAQPLAEGSLQSASRRGPFDCVMLYGGCLGLGLAEVGIWGRNLRERRGHTAFQQPTCAMWARDASVHQCEKGAGVRTWVGRGWASRGSSSWGWGGGHASAVRRRGAAVGSSWQGDAPAAKGVLLSCTQALCCTRASSCR